MDSLNGRPIVENDFSELFQLLDVEQVSHKLYAKNIITRYDLEIIKSKTTTVEKQEEFLQIIQSKDNSFEATCKALEECKQTFLQNPLQKYFDYKKSSDHPRDNFVHLHEQQKTKTLLPKWWPEKQVPVDGFVERKAIIDELYRKLQTGQAVISGLPGTGKTTTAKWFANIYQADYDHILWFDSEQRLEIRFKELATKLNIKIINEEKTSRQIRDIIIDIYSNRELQKTKCLLIFDNAEDYQSIQDFLPNHSENHSEKEARRDILVTSHKRDFFTKRIEDGIDLSGFTAEEAMAFVKNRLKIDENDTRFDTAIKELAFQLQCLPLALTIAISSMKTNGELNDYVKLYKESEKAATRLINENDRNNPYYRKSIIAAFKVTIDKIKEEDGEAELAEAVMHSIAYCNADDVPKELFLSLIHRSVKKEEDVADLQAKKDLNDALNILERYSLIKVNENRVESGKRDSNDFETNDETLSIHRLLQASIRRKLKYENKEMKALVNVLDLLEKVANYVPKQKSVWKRIKNVFGNKPYLNEVKEAYLNERYITHAVSVWAAISGQGVNKKLIGKHKIFAEYILVAAAKLGNEKLVGWLLEGGVNVNARNENGWTALHWVARYGKVDCVKALIEAGAEVNAKEKDGSTALHWAAENGEVDCVKALIEAGADLNAIDSYGSTALHWAARNEKIDCLKALIEAGADLNAIENIYGYTALHWAALNGFVDCVKALIEAGADVNAKESDGETALHWAARYGVVDCVKALIEAGAVNAKKSYGWTALHVAARNGKVDCVKALIEAGADVNAKESDGETALHWAAENGEVDCVKALIEAGADLNIQSTSGRTTLHEAALNEKVDCVKALIEAGADLNAKENKYGLTALHVAARYGFVDCVKALIEAGADVNAKESDGWTALHVAARNGEVDCVKALIEAGADVNAKEKIFGKTALHVAAGNGEVDCVKALIEAGADLNAKESDGSTALHVAARNEKVDCVKALIKAGADVKLKDNLWRTALNLAVDYNNLKCVNYMKSVMK